MDADSVTTSPVDGRWSAAAIVAAGVAALAVGTSSLPAFLALAAVALVGTAYAAHHWPRATLVGVAITTLLDPGVATRFLPPTLADGPIGISEPLLAVTGLVALGRIGRAGLRAVVVDPTVVLAALFAALAIVSALANAVPPHVAAFGILMTIDAMVIYVIWRALRPSVQDAMRAITALVAAGVVVAAFGIGQVLLTPTLLGFERFALFPGEVGRITSFLGNPNLLAPILGFLVPFPLFAVVRLSDRRWRAIAAAAALTLLVALVLTFSRGAWIAAAAGVTLGALVLDWRALAVGVVLAAMAAALVMVMPTHLIGTDPTAMASRSSVGVSVGRPPMEATAGEATPDPYAGLSSEEIRLRFLRDGLRIVNENPVLGVGPGRYGGAVATIFPSPVYDEYGTTLGRFRTVHNFWLHLAGEGGVLGVTVFIAIVASLIIRLARAARAAAGARFMVLAGAATAALVVAINNSTEMIFEGNIPAVIVWLMLAIGAALVPDPRLGLLPSTRRPAT